MRIVQRAVAFALATLITTASTPALADGWPCHDFVVKLHPDAVRQVKTARSNDDASFRIDQLFMTAENRTKGACLDTMKKMHQDALRQVGTSSDMNVVASRIDNLFTSYESRIQY